MTDEGPGILKTMHNAEDEEKDEEKSTVPNTRLI